MNPQKNQGGEPSPLFHDLQAEVAAESAPLLQFMLRHAGLIAGVAVLFLLVLAGTGLWGWYSGGKSEDARQELARISMRARRGRSASGRWPRWPKARRLMCVFPYC